MGNTILRFTRKGILASEEVETQYMGKKIVSSDYSYEELPKNILKKLGIQDIKVEWNERKEIDSIELMFPPKEPEQVSQNIKDKVPSWKKSHIEGMEKPNHIGYVIRKYLKEQKKVSWKKLCDYLDRIGYTNPRTNGAVFEAFKILRDDRREIKQIGRGDDKEFEWIGD